MTRTCKICKNIFQNRKYIAREMMLGLREEFEYFECGQCGCLQILHIPKCMIKYYPADYFAFHKINSMKPDKFKRFLRQRVTMAYLNGLKAFRSTDIPHWMHSEWKRKYGFNINSNILDVGCGNGKLLLRLHKLGFNKLMGIDPYIIDNYYFNNGIRIYKMQLNDLDETFDFIMLNHSFEHIEEPLSTLQKLFQITHKNSLLMIRIPVVSSLAWRKYKTHWVQLDAPRHFFLHSIKSMEILCQKAGFAIENIEFDSTAFQFCGSEQYLADIALHDNKSIYKGIKKSIFTGSQIKKFHILANRLNQKNDGDQACFLLKRK